MKKSTYKNVKMRDNNFRGQVFNIIKMLLIVLIIFGVFYLFTLYLVRESDSDSNDSTVSDNANISYEEILVGNSFDMSGEYLVLYYDHSEDELESKFTNLISEYKSKENSLSVYIVDMDNALNTKYISDDSNTSPKSVSELKIKGSTLIKFNNGNVIDYIEGEENITSYLE